jgi:hypothetical protein
MKFTTLLGICYILAVLVPSSMCLSLAKLGWRSSNERTEKNSVVKDTIPPHPIKIVKVPGTVKKNVVVFSDEASEELGDQIPQTSDSKETTYYEGEEGQQQINGVKKITSSKYPVRRSVVKGIVLPHLTE